MALYISHSIFHLVRVCMSGRKLLEFTTYILLHCRYLNGTHGPYRECVKCLEKLQQRVAHNKQENSSLQYMSANLFSSNSPHIHLASILNISIHGTFRNPQCIKLQFEMEIIFTNTIFMPVKLFSTTYAPLKGCDRP